MVIIMMITMMMMVMMMIDDGCVFICCASTDFVLFYFIRTCLVKEKERKIVLLVVCYSDRKNSCKYIIANGLRIFPRLPVVYYCLILLLPVCLLRQRTHDADGCFRKKFGTFVILARRKGRDEHDCMTCSH